MPHSTYWRIAMLLMLVVMPVTDVWAQTAAVGGRIVSVDDNTVSVVFDDVDLSVGDELRFVRHFEITDPVSGRVRGGRDEDIATGIVEDLALDRAVVNIVTRTDAGGAILLSDRVYYTGRVKRVIRTREVVGRVQTLLSDRAVEIDVGSDDEINEGDMFLIRRTENVYNPDTNEVMDTRRVDVGRGRVESVAASTSRASVVEYLPGMTAAENDEVVFAPETASANETALPRETGPVPTVDSGEIVRLQDEIDDLRVEVARLRAVVDSLGRRQDTQQAAIDALGGEMVQTARDLLARDIADDGVVIRDGGEAPVVLADDLAVAYRKALDDCLGHRFDTAIAEFTDILARYPDQPLAENCRYWIAQSRYTGGDLAGAAEQFRQVLVDTRFTHKDDDAAIMLGITCYRRGQIEDARREFESFLQRFPESEYRTRAESWLGRLS